MGAVRRNCVLCGTTYEYCPNCGQEAPVWKTVYCSENCRDVIQTLNLYDGKEISKQEASEKLKKLDLSKKDSFLEKFKKLAGEFDAPKRKAEKEEKIEIKEEDSLKVDLFEDKKKEESKKKAESKTQSRNKSKSRSNRKSLF